MKCLIVKYSIIQNQLQNAHNNVHRLQRLPFFACQDHLTSSSTLSDYYVGYHASSMERLLVILPTTTHMQTIIFCNEC